MKSKFLSVVSIVAISLFVAALWHYWPAIVKGILTTQADFHSLLSRHISQFKENPRVSGAMLVAISFAYGVFHAAGPGHGKAVLVTYLSTQKDTLKQGIFISFAAAIFQAIVAISIVSIISILLSQTFSQTNLVSLRTEQTSYVLVILFGGYILWRSVLKVKKRLVGARNDHHSHDHHSHDHHSHDHHSHDHHSHDHHSHDHHSHDHHSHNHHSHNHHSHNHHSHNHHSHNHHSHNHHSHNHHSHNHHSHNYHSHDHGDQCCHTYKPVEKVSPWQTLGIIVAMGARPCTGAIMVLIYSHIVGIYWVGISATLLMGLGTGLTVASLGFITILFREQLSKVVSSDASHGHHNSTVGLFISCFGGILLLLLGFSLFQASIETAVQHPLF
ncbi:nickel/cobalt transporter [Reinekea thalattae]|nr:hypothetical protein [Reinekea thalattae]